MIKLHLICSDDDLRPAMCHIKFTQNEAIACDGYALVIAQTENVMPDIVQDGETLYIHQKEWKKAKAFDAVRFERDGDTVICYDRKFRRSVMQITTEDSFDRIYPDVHSAIPDSFEGSINQIAFNPRDIARVCDAVGFQHSKLTFNAANRAIKVEPFEQYHHETYANVIAIVMPKFFQP